MGGVWSSLRESVERGLERRRQRDFLEVAMAAVAWVAMADDEVRLSEQIALDHVLENLRELQVFDPHQGVELCRVHVQGLARDRAGTEEQLRKIIGRLSGDGEKARLLIRVACAIARADGNFDAGERAVVGEIGKLLNVEVSEEILHPD